MPNYRNQFSKDSQAINIDYCKSFILNSYVLVEQNNWQEIKSQMTSAMNYFSRVMESISENTQNQNRISKTYILLNELNNSIELQDRELFYIKYRNVMQELLDF